MGDILISFRALRNSPDYDEKIMAISDLIQCLEVNQAGYECSMAWRLDDNGQRVEDIYLITLSPEGYAIYQLIKD